MQLNPSQQNDSFDCYKLEHILKELNWQNKMDRPTKIQIDNIFGLSLHRATLQLNSLDFLSVPGSIKLLQCLVSLVGPFGPHWMQQILVCIHPTDRRKKWKLLSIWKNDFEIYDTWQCEGRRVDDCTHRQKKKMKLVDYIYTWCRTFVVRWPESRWLGASFSSFLAFSFGEIRALPCRPRSTIWLRFSIID